MQAFSLNIFLARSHFAGLIRKFVYSFFWCFLAIDFCRCCVVIRFFIPATTANDLQLRRIFYPRFYPFIIHLFSYLNSWQTMRKFVYSHTLIIIDLILFLHPSILILEIKFLTLSRFCCYVGDLKTDLILTLTMTL